MRKSDGAEQWTNDIDRHTEGCATERAFHGNQKKLSTGFAGQERRSESERVNVRALCRFSGCPQDLESAGSRARGQGSRGMPPNSSEGQLV